MNGRTHRSAPTENPKHQIRNGTMSGLLKPLASLLFGSEEKAPEPVALPELPEETKGDATSEREAEEKRRRQRALAGGRGSTILTGGVDLGAAPREKEDAAGGNRKKMVFFPNLFVGQKF